VSLLSLSFYPTNLVLTFLAGFLGAPKLPSMTKLAFPGHDSDDNLTSLLSGPWPGCVGCNSWAGASYDNIGALCPGKRSIAPALRPGMKLALSLSRPMDEKSVTGSLSPNFDGWDPVEFTRPHGVAPHGAS
jgi:hypothetical protein